MTVSLLPPPLYLDASSEAGGLPPVQANLMPFHIDYSGPAPIDAFMVLRQAEGHEDETPGAESHDPTAVTAKPTAESLVSAFRGRTIQSTQLPLPKGYVGRIVSASTSVVPSATPASSGPEVDPDRPSSAKKARLDAAASSRAQRNRLPPPPKPAKMQRFSMDDEDDDEQEEDEEEDEDHDERAEAGNGLDGLPTQGRDGAGNDGDDDPEPAQLASPAEPAQPEVRQMLRPIAAMADDAIRVWGPDGPVDRGDDVFFRTVEEWVGVVCAEIHAD
ncbi:uncharacterized protein PFL1_05339 [Pseudozyma flocculosa PF-1]|uniref:Uncharacterized protein n=2 Tax=Pseudozyma flocculosa TaxID=84751 RepID=A0A5C3FCK0_9BASI|nr:uncharacterized protein PFL1_05339 [Pseudozyma flocculosa PF-1]EPQ27055.1 hypothetical protein PFL1_05339 [Pseudozyma flocculosa PF-1]SPO42132.1 uncharacterized protein PSFLO_07615 [Pseudozyma flocculosa]